MAELKFYKSSSKAVKLIAISSLFVAIGISFIIEYKTGTSKNTMGWFGTCFFGLGIPIGIYQLFDRRAQIIITENGIWDRTTNESEIIWEQIKDAYVLNINNQKFISLVVVENYVFNKEHNILAAKINEIVGAQKINLNLSQVKIDEAKLEELIQKLTKVTKSERNNLIRFYNVSSVFSLNYIQYLLIIFGLFFVSMVNFYAFWTIMIVMGISGFIARWYRHSNNNSKLRKYSEKTALFGFVNMVLIFFAFKIYDNTTNQIGIKITNQIENHKTKYGKYPKDIKTITQNLELNPIQKYITNEIEYKVSGKYYKIELEFLNHNRKEFDTELNEWN